MSSADGDGAEGGFLPGEGGEAAEAPTQLPAGLGAAPGTPGADPLKWLCQKRLGVLFPDKNAKSLESFEERIPLSSSFPLGLKAHKKLPCDYCDRASRRESRLKSGCLAEIS